MTEIERVDQIAFQIGRRVRERRVAEKLSEEVVARALGKPLNYLRDSESGRANFSAEDIVELCSLLHVRPSWFFEGLV